MERKSNFELLRILSMVMIVTLHFFSHGNGAGNVLNGTLYYYITRFIVACAQTGVDCFVLLSSYFLVDKDFKISRLLKLMSKVLFYSVLCLAVSFFFRRPSLKEIAFACFPITSSQYWFITQYALLLVFSPIVNGTIRKSTDDELLRITFLFVVLFSVLPTVLPWARNHITNGKDITWFVTLYLVAACLKRSSLLDRVRHPLGMYLLFTLFTTFADSGIEALTGRFGFDGRNLLYTHNSIAVLAAAVMLFEWIKRISLPKRTERMLLQVSQGVFGVYLFHDNPLLRETLWRKMRLLFIPGRCFLIVNLLTTVVVVFVLGACIEAVRTVIFRAFGIDSFSDKADKRFSVKRK